MQVVRSKDGTALAYEVRGTGPALVYVAGAICHRRFQPIVDDVNVLAQSFTVLSYDRRGRGDSSAAASDDPQAEIDDLAAVIGAAGGSAYVYGHSSGAVLALEAALAFPKNVKKVLIYDPPYVADEQEREHVQQTKQRIQTLLTANRRARAIRTFLLSIGVPRIATALFGLVPGWSKTVRLAPTLLYDIRLTEDYAPVERLKRITVPTLVGFGEKSPHGMHRVANLIADAIPNARSRGFPGQDHMVAAKALLPVMEAFFLGEA